LRLITSLQQFSFQRTTVTTNDGMRLEHGSNVAIPAGSCIWQSRGSKTART